MTDLWGLLLSFLDFLRPYSSYIIVAAAGALVTKFLPFVWRIVCKISSKCARIMGGRLASREFEKRYLDWVVTQNQELKLTGVVSYDEAKKPQLEQVFVSLRMGEKKEGVDQPSQEIVLQEYLSKVYERHGIAFTDYSNRGTRTIAELQSTYEDVLIRRYERKIALSKYERYVSGRAIRRRIVGPGRVIYEIVERKPQLQVILQKYDRLAILGGPGAGKTTFLQYIALAYARERAGDRRLRRRRIMKDRLGTKRWRLPIFISLSSISASLTNPVNGRSASVADTIPGTLPPDLQKDPIAAEYFLRQLENGNCVVLLDGLDEVPADTDFLAVVRAIESLALRYNKNQFILTSRISGWRSGVGANFEIFYVNELTDEQIETFIDRWYSAVELNAVSGRLQDEGEALRRARERRASERAEGLKRTLRENPGIRNLATNPMLLSIIALVHRSMATLPKERGKLYAECSKILLQQWDYSRGVRVDDTNLTLAQKEAIMQRLAFAIHQGEIGKEGGGREAGRQQIDGIIAEMLPRLGSKAEASHLLQRLIERSGLIVERQRDVLSFAHHTFQEYFAAQYLAREEGSSNRLFLADPNRVLSDWWREVVLLYAGLLPDATNFIRSFYDSASDDLFRQRLRLGGLCVGEAVEVKDVVLRRKIIVELLNNRTRGEVNSVEEDLAADIVSFLIRWAGDQSWFVNAILTRVKAEGYTDGIKHLLLSSLETSGSNIACVAALKALLLLPDLYTNEIVKAVISLSSNKDLEIRQNALAGLGPIGKTKMTEQITSCLIRAIGDTESVRNVAISSLQSIGHVEEDSHSAYVKLDEMLKDGDRSVQFAAVRLFSVFAKHPPSELVEHFVDVITDSPYRFLPEVLAKLQGVALDAVTLKLIGLVENPDAKGRISAMCLLPELPVETIRHYKVVEKLLSALTSRYQIDREYACFVLTTFIERSLANDVFEGLLRTCVSDIEQARNSIGETRTSDSMPTVAPHKLIDLVPHDNGPMRAVAIRLLGKLAHPPSSDEALDTLRRLLYDKRPVVLTAAIHAIGEQGERAQSEEVIARLLELAKRKNIFRRFASRVSQLRAETSPLNELRNYRLASIKALGLLGISQRERIVDLLQKDFETEGDFEIQHHTLEMLLNLTAKSPSLKIFDMVFDELAKEIEFYVSMDWTDMGYMRHFAKSIPNRLIDSSVILASQLPDDVVASKLLDALVSGQVGRRALSLLIMRKLQNVASNDLVIGQVCLNLDDSKLPIRTAALDVVEKALNKSTAPSILSALTKRLSDEIPEVREKAWLLVEKWNIASGSWVSSSPTAPAAARDERLTPT